MKHKSQKTRQKTDTGKPDENQPVFHTGGTVTGRLTRSLPEHQEILSSHRFAHENPNPQYVRRGGRPVAEVLVSIDFAEIERRVLANLLNKTARGIVSRALDVVVAETRERIDEEGCGAVFAAMASCV